MARLALNWKKKWKWSLGSVAKRLWAQRIWKEASFEGGALLPILFFIVAPITIITDKKVGAGFRNSIFAKHSGAASTHNWLRGPLWGSGWGFRAYIGMQSAHFRAIYSYIWKHDMRFYTSLPLSLFRPGFTRFSMRGWPSPPPPQPCALSRKCICTIWRRTEDERMLSTHSGICLFSVERRNQHKSNKRDFPSASSTNPTLLYIIIAHFSKTAWGHHPLHDHHHHDHHHLGNEGGDYCGERERGERQSSGRRLNMMQKLTRECKKGNCSLNIFKSTKIMKGHFHDWFPKILTLI